MDAFVKPLTLFESNNKSSLYECFAQVIPDIQTHNNILNIFSDPILYKDRNSHFIGCNKSLSSIAGYGSPEDMIHKKDDDMVWASGGLTNEFVKRDIRLNMGFHQLNIGRYLYIDGLKTMLIRRFPLYNNDVIVGNFTILREVEKPSLKNILDCIYSFGCHLTNTELLEQIDATFVETAQAQKPDLTLQEQKVLFHAIRGTSIKKIAVRLHLSSERVKKIMSQIKKKFSCETKEELFTEVINSRFVFNLI